MVNRREFLFADVAMLRIYLGGAFPLLLLKVLRSEYVGGCEFDFPAKRSNPRLAKHSVCTFCPRRHPFARSRLHPAPPRNRIGKVRLCNRPMETLSLIGWHISEKFAIRDDRFQQFGC
jgi:hypothetical protein